MLSKFCLSWVKSLCIFASIAAPLVGLATADVQGELPPVGALTAGTTGTASQIHIVNDAVTDQEYVGVLPDQQEIAVLGPTGDPLRVEVRLTSPPPATSR